MVYTTLSLDDFLGMESTPNMTRMDYLLAVSEVSWLKSLIGEEDDLIAKKGEKDRIEKEERITHKIKSILSSFPEVVDHRQEKSSLDIVVPRGKRSMLNARPRKVTDQFLCNGDESMIKKAVENTSYNEENRWIKIKWGAVSNFVVGEKTPIGVSNQEFEADFAPLPVKKRSREVAFNALDLNNQELAAPAVIIHRELNIEFKNLITSLGGSLESVTLVIEKRLFISDIRTGQGRLSIPLNQLSSKFLKPEEVALLNMRNGRRVRGMSVTLIEPSLQVSQIILKKWTLNKVHGNPTASYVLVTRWNDVARRHGLRIGMQVQLWAFRNDEKLCFALVKAEDSS